MFRLQPPPFLSTILVFANALTCLDSVSTPSIEDGPSPMDDRKRQANISGPEMAWGRWLWPGLQSTSRWTSMQ